MLYPLKFKKVLIPKVWGGRNLQEKLGIELPDDRNFGESWEVSSHKNGMSEVENGYLSGRQLQSLLEEFKQELVGEEIYTKYGNRFPLLIKYLDVNDRLSIQVHPSDEYALKNHNELGKCESWFIMYASDDAKLIMGMKKGINKEKFLEKTKNNDFVDIIDVIPGSVHASLEGSVIFAEIQENSDITYRIYDFDRLDNGKKRELHLDRAAEVIDFNLIPEVRNTNFKDDEIRKNISNTDFYSIDRIKILDEFEDSYKNMLIYSILEGEGVIEYLGESLKVKKGETVLIPANIKVKVKGSLELLRSLAI